MLVVNGLSSMAERASESRRLLQYGLKAFEPRVLFAKGEKLADAEIWLGAEDHVPLVAMREGSITLPKETRPEDVAMTVRYNGPLAAPVEAGAQVAELVIAVKGLPEEKHIPLAAGEAVAEMGTVGRAFHVLKQKLLP